MKKILIVEDDSVLCQELSTLLENSGYQVKSVEDFDRVSAQMAVADADLILLDINLPQENGEVLLQEFRKKKDTPVIMLTSRCSDLDEILSMSYGADDYITKPYNPAILLLRISALLKRVSRDGAGQSYDGIQVSPLKGSLVRGDQEEFLTKNEMIIFQMLLERRGEIVTRDDLMTALWDSEEFVSDNTLTVNISRLRRKLADFGLPDAIETRKKQGYVLK